MNTFLVIVIVLLAIMVVVSLVRGIIAFLQSTRMDLNSQASGDHATEMQLRQNSAMFSRIKYQAAAILVVAVLLLTNR